MSSISLGTPGRRDHLPPTSNRSPGAVPTSFGISLPWCGCGRRACFLLLSGMGVPLAAKRHGASEHALVLHQLHPRAAEAASW